MLNRYSSCGAPASARQAWLRSPLLGAASSSQAMAPRNGGVTNDAVTSARMVRRSGMSVRATSQPMGAARRQQAMLDVVAMITVVISGSMNTGSVTSRTKLSKVNAPVRSVTLKYISHDIGSTISRHRITAKATRIGHDRSMPPGRRAGSAGSAMLMASPTDDAGRPREGVDPCPPANGLLRDRWSWVPACAETTERTSCVYL